MERNSAPLPNPNKSDTEVGHELDLPPPPRRSRLGEGAVTVVGAAYESYRPKRRANPPIETGGVRVSIPGHPEIIAYKMRGFPTRDHTVDDLIKLDKLITRESDVPSE